MSLNETPSSERITISFFGCMNAGKSSLVNAVTGQDLAVVSDVAGTTTDPVLKTMELLPLGPVVIIDTPGFDDSGELGSMRVEKARRIMNRTDIAVLVIDGNTGWKAGDRELLEMIKSREIPYLAVLSKCDQPDAVSAGCADAAKDAEPSGGADALFPVSAKTGFNIHELKRRIASLTDGKGHTRRLAGDLVSPGKAAICVCPIDESAPKGRLILPQQQVIRDIMEAGAIAIVTKETELDAALSSLTCPPDIVITDSQAFRMVSGIVPDEIPLTSFSILMARYKGWLESAVSGAKAIRSLKDGDRVLMAEGCTHHRQCNDIGTVKIPNWLKKSTGKELQIETSSGHDFPDDLSPFALVIHCGGCMISEREVLQRMRSAADQNVPFTNYGIAIASMTGILERSIRIFPDIHKLYVEGAYE